MTPFTANQQVNPTTTQADDSVLTQNLFHYLQQQKQSVDKLIELLDQEYDAILARDREVMGQMIDKKLPLLSQIEQTDGQLQSLFQQITHTAYSASAFSTFLEQHSSKDIQTVWQTIKANLPQCKDKNELNGRILNIRKKNTDEILQILTGRPANTSQTYGTSGMTQQQKKCALYTSV